MRAHNCSREKRATRGQDRVGAAPPSEAAELSVLQSRCLITADGTTGHRKTKPQMPRQQRPTGRVVRGSHGPLTRRPQSPLMAQLSHTVSRACPTRRPCRNTHQAHRPGAQVQEPPEQVECSQPVHLAQQHLRRKTDKGLLQAVEAGPVASGVTGRLRCPLTAAGAPFTLTSPGQAGEANTCLFMNG